MKEYVLLSQNATIEDKLRILSDAAKYDVSCSSSGVERRGNGKDMGSSSAAGICHSFAADGRCISLLKILFTNECIFDCRYCVNRVSNDVPRAAFTPEELCKLTMEFYRRNYIEGLFLSSGIIQSPDYTMGQIYEAIWKLRMEYHFRGYIHVKAIPGCDPELVERLGYLTDRMSVNLELPTADGLSTLAPHKNRRSILTPMKEIQTGITNNRQMHGIKNMKQSIVMTDAGYDQQSRVLPELSEEALRESREGLMERLGSRGKRSVQDSDVADLGKQGNEIRTASYVGTNGKYFVPAGQSTQMIIGATGESDYTLLQTSQALYQGFDLKRVFYSAYIPLNDDSILPQIGTPPPLLREHRLYQADWLLRFYGFQADELLSESQPNFNELLDPKCDWALRHLEHFPVEVEKASYATLLRVPGIGPKSASRITYARRYGRLNFDNLKRMGVVLKRAHYFITCGGRQMYRTPIEEAYITRQLVQVDAKDSWKVQHSNESYSQMTLADFGIG